MSSNNLSSLGAVEDESRPYLTFYRTSRFVTGLLVYPVICAFGLVGNSLVVAVLARKPSRTSTDVFLVALAISDQVKLLNDLLYFVTCLVLHLDQRAGARLFAHLYPYAHFFFNSSACVSSWLTVSLAVERYVLVCHATLAPSLVSPTRSAAVVVVVFAVMTVIALPSGFRYRTVVVANDPKPSYDVELTELWRKDAFSRSYNWLQSLLRSIVPLLILVVTSAFIVNDLRKVRANRRFAQRNRITVMLTVVIAVFIAGILPDAVMSSLYLGYTESDSYLVKGVREVTDLLLAVNASVNFLLYLIFNRKFRIAFKQQFRVDGCNRVRARARTRRMANANNAVVFGGVNTISEKPIRFLEGQ